MTRPVQSWKRAWSTDSSTPPVREPEGLLVDRESLRPAVGARRAQTPQVFRGPDLIAAYGRAAREGFEGRDTADVMQRFSTVVIVGLPGDGQNLKVTYASDLEVARDRIRARSRS